MVPDAAFDPSPANVSRVLSHSRLFYGMSPTSLMDLVSRGHVEEWDAGRLYRLPANELRIILRGDIHLPTEAGGPAIVLGRGNFVGEVGLLDLALGQLLDLFEARSLGGCSCLVLLPHEVNEWIRQHPRLEGPFFKHLAQELLNRCLGVETEQAAREAARFRRKIG